MKVRAALAITVLLAVACERSAQEVADPCGDLDASITKAVRLRKSARNREAETLYLKILDTVLARRCGYQEARIWNNLGTLAIVEGRLTESLRHLEKAKRALATFDSSSEEDLQRARELEATVASNLGNAFFRLGWLDEARDALQRARALNRLVDAESQDWATVLLFTAQVNRLRGETQAAADAVGEALELTDAQPKTRASLYMEQARLALGEGRFEDAERSLDRAEEVVKGSGNPLHIANVISDRAELEMRRGRAAESLRWAEEALGLARGAAPDLNLEAHGLFLKSVALSKLGEPDRSRRAAETALALLDGTRDAWHDLGLEYLAYRQGYYRHRLDLAAQNEEPEATWKVFERYRAQGLLEIASQRAMDFSEAADTEAREKITARRADLLEAVRALDALGPGAPDDLVQAQEARFRDRRLALRKLQVERRTAPGVSGSEIGLAAALEMLDADALALAFAAGTERLYALAVDRQQGVRVVPLDAKVEHVEGQVRELIRGLGPNGMSRARHQVDRNVEDLSHALLGPLVDDLDEFHRLLIVADGPLERLPFEILRNPGNGRRLVASHEIAYVPSFSVLAASRERACSAAKSGLFALGDPIFGSHDDRWSGADDPRNDDETLAFQRLPASAAEVRAIAELYADDATVALGRDATRARFLAAAPEHRILHVASHARSNQQAPERSRIALSCLDAAGRVPETCDLYFEDVAALDLCGQVVVLSACDTAGGHPVAGEGILGLPWVFLRAGAATVVASLWRVADEPTAELMTSFHRHLRDGAGPAAALRQAKLELIDAERPPSDWAAFVLLGDWRFAPLSSTFSSPSGPME